MIYYLVKLKGTQFVDVFESSNVYEINTEVIVNSERGLEIGKITREMHPMKALGTIQYQADSFDIEKYWTNVEESEKAYEKTKKRIQEHNLDMNLLSVQYNLDQSKVFITYTSNDRVDFRTLLRDLSLDLKTRIEFRQLGARDYAKHVGCLGTCSQIACCAFKKDFQSITMNMAKNQMIPLNNESLTGVCGSLKCCLAYENETYLECRKHYPKIKSKIIYKDKEFRVVDFNCISETILISNEDERLTVPLSVLKGA